jgi:hypothetical protein
MSPETIREWDVSVIIQIWGFSGEQRVTPLNRELTMEGLAL